MTLYYSENVLSKEIKDHFRKLFPRGEISSNYLNIMRADTIDEDLFLKYFECAVTNQHDLYTVFISLPLNIENRIPFWFIQDESQIWVDPNSGMRGQNINGEDVFITKFNLYVNEKAVKKFPETSNVSLEEALIGEFIEIRHALINGNDEPIDVLRDFYGFHETSVPKSKVAKYLASIIKSK